MLSVSLIWSSALDWLEYVTTPELSVLYNCVQRLQVPFRQYPIRGQTHTSTGLNLWRSLGLLFYLNFLNPPHVDPIAVLFYDLCCLSIKGHKNLYDPSPKHRSYGFLLQRGEYGLYPNPISSIPSHNNVPMFSDHSVPKVVM